MRRVTTIWLKAALLLPLIAATAPAPGAPDRAWLAGARKAQAVPQRLPRAGDRSFRSLDEYLAWLREHAAPVDRPWYREVWPGLYQLQTGNLRRPGRPARLFTRAELERKFGFRR